jgi:hypothetical protein
MTSGISPQAASQSVDVAADWDQAHRYTPAPRHRRRLLRKIVARLDTTEVLDAGCAQPFLIKDLVDRLGVKGAGCDLSPKVMAQSREELPELDFEAFDLAEQRWPGDRTFETVVCAETLEHIKDWQAALANVIAMSRKHVVVTVPSKKIRTVDKLMGHYRHFEADDITTELERHGLRVSSVRYWGFPVHSAYRAAVERFGSDKVYESFAEGKELSRAQRAMSEILYAMFFANDLFRGGSQLIVVAHREGAA